MNKCPNPNCIEGIIDTGGFTPWGSPIFVSCDYCIQESLKEMKLNKKKIEFPTETKLIRGTKCDYVFVDDYKYYTSPLISKPHISRPIRKLPKSYVKGM